MQSPAVTKSRVRLHPNNQPSGNTYSARNFPQINFIIGKQRAFLDPRTLRLNGEFSLIGPGSGAVPSDAGLPRNDQTAAQSDINGATLNNMIGISSIFDEVTVSTLNGRNIETVRNYNRYLASSKPLMNGSMDYSNGLGLKDPMVSDKSVTNQKTACVATDFSIPVDIGLFQGGGVNLSEKGFHGLQIDWLLAQNAQVVQPYYLYSPDGSKVGKTSQTTYEYEIKNLTLTFDVLRPNQSMFDMLPTTGALSYNTISSLHSVLLSSDQTINMRFGAKNVISVSHSIIPSIHVNNIAVDSFRLCPPQTGVTQTTDGNVAPIKNVQYMRAGVLFPYNFMLDSEAQADINGAQGNASPQAQIMQPYLESVSLGNNRRNKFSPNTNIGLLTSAALAGSGGLPFGSAADPRSVYGLGVPMDTTRQGVDFSSREYAIRIQSDLRDQDANAFFTFTRIRNVAQYSPLGIQVVE